MNRLSLTLCAVLALSLASCTLPGSRAQEDVTNEIRGLELAKTEVSAAYDTWQEQTDLTAGTDESREAMTEAIAVSRVTVIRILDGVIQSLGARASVAVDWRALYQQGLQTGADIWSAVGSGRTQKGGGQ